MCETIEEMRNKAYNDCCKEIAARIIQCDADLDFDIIAHITHLSVDEVKSIAAGIIRSIERTKKYIHLFQPEDEAILWPLEMIKKHILRYMTKEELLQINGDLEAADDAEVSATSDRLLEINKDSYSGLAE